MKKTETKNFKVALYNPFLDTLGGGEKHILSIVDVLAEQGADVTIFWDKSLKKEIANRFSLQSIKRLKWVDKRTLKNLWPYDYFFYVTDGSYFFSSAKKNFVFCMVPDKKLYNLNLLNRLKLWNYKFISNSPFTTKWLTRWGINPVTIPPYVDDKLFANNQNKKGKIILSVGRFFSHLHSKNQGEIIETFKKLKNQSQKFKDYKLILAGGLKKEDQLYFDELKQTANDDPSIIFKPNLSLYELYKLYELSVFFWHFTGLGIDEEKHPEMVEHFGIAPLEAMASGCLTFCYSAGGPKELINDGKNGFLFTDVNELINKIIKVNSNETLKEKVIKNGKQFVKENFSYDIFRDKVVSSLIKVRPSSKD